MGLKATTKRGSMMATIAVGALAAFGAAPSHAGSEGGSFIQLAERETNSFFRSTSSREQASQALRISQLEEQIRRMNGQVEEMSYQMRQLQEQLRRMQEDNEFRFQELESGGGRRKRSEAPASAPSAPVDTGSVEQPVPESQVLGTITETAPNGEVTDQIGRAIGQPLDLSTLAGGGNNFSAALPQGESETDGVQPVNAPSADARADYDVAYDYVLRGDYDRAETSLRNFIDMHPEHNLVPNAKYWLGESLLARKSYKEAADTFLDLYSAYPESNKAPDSLFKLGQSLYGMGERSAACATYAELLDKHGDAASVLRRRVAAEMQKAQCSG